MPNQLRNAIAFLSGKKTYIVAFATLVYALGISRNWWAHSAEIDLYLGGAGAITIRAAIAKLIAAIESDQEITGIQSGAPLMARKLP